MWGIRYVVLDEADTMFDRGFGAEVRQVLKPVRQKEDPCKVVLVTATLTKVGTVQNNAPVLPSKL